MNKYIALVLALTCSPIVVAESSTKTINSKSAYQGVAWLQKPKIQVNNHELRGESRSVTVRIHVNTLGNIEKTEIIKTSGVSALDRKVQRALMISKFRPYKVNGVAQSFVAEQPFEFKATKESRTPTLKSSIDHCKIEFNSDQWQAQQAGTDIKFRYLNKPNVYFIESQLEHQSRDVQVAFKLSKKNEISNLEITKSSGLNLVDNHVLHAFQQIKIEAPRKFYQFYKLTFTDRIYFNVDDCK